MGPVASRATDVKHLDLIAIDSEERPMRTLSPTEDKLTDFWFDKRIFRCQLKALGKVCERLQFGLESI